MVIRKGSCSRLSVAFKCWVKPDWVFPACLPGLGAYGSQQGAFPNLCARGTGEFPSFLPPQNPGVEFHLTCTNAWGGYSSELSLSGHHSMQP